MTERLEQRPTLVLMAGFGGSGKTTLAHALARRLRWPVLDKDVLKTGIIRTHESISEQAASKLAYNLLFELARDILMLQGISVILDTSAAYAEVSDYARDLTHLAGARLRIILCKANKHIREQRLQSRNEQDAGRRQLLINLSMAGEDNWKRFDHLPVDCLLSLDTTQPLEGYLQQALRYLLDDQAVS